MTRRVDLTQWRDRTQEPAIVCVYDGCWELLPVAVDDSHEGDLYDELTRAFYAARAYMTFEEVCEEYAEDFTPDQIEALYNAGDWSAEREGLPTQYYAQGTEEDGSDTLIYVNEETFSGSHRATLEEETPYLDPEDVAAIYREILAARAE